MKKVIKIFLIFLCIVFLFFVANFMYLLSMSGSYPYSEDYVINLPEDEVIQKIIELKEKEPSLQVPPAGPPFGALKDEKDGYWYYVYFLLEDKQTVLFCFVRSIDRYRTTVGLISVGTGVTFLNRKHINARGLFFKLKDLSEKENKQFKKDFEQQVLSKLKVEWKKE